MKLLFLEEDFTDHTSYEIVEEEGSTDHMPLNDIVEEQEVTEHGDEAEQTEAGHNVDHRVL